MAACKKKPVKVKFELAKSSIGGIAVVVFCLFLWTFIFGVWAGQSMLAPQTRGGKEKAQSISIRKKIEIVPTVKQQSSKSSATIPVVPAEQRTLIKAERKAIKKGY